MATGSGGKQPYLIRFADARPFAFAGVWERWSRSDDAPLESCAIITTEANQVVAPVHDRMPVILAPGCYRDWLGTGELAAPELEALLTPHPEAEMEAIAVSRRVNSPSNDDPGCIEPLASDRLW